MAKGCLCCGCPIPDGPGSGGYCERCSGPKEGVLATNQPLTREQMMGLAREVLALKAQLDEPLARTATAIKMLEESHRREAKDKIIRWAIVERSVDLARAVEVLMKALELEHQWRANRYAADGLPRARSIDDYTIPRAAREIEAERGGK